MDELINNIQKKIQTGEMLLTEISPQTLTSLQTRYLHEKNWQMVQLISSIARNRTIENQSFTGKIALELV
jgi:hypothetical protein